MKHHAQIALVGVLTIALLAVFAGAGTVLARPNAQATETPTVTTTATTTATSPVPTDNVIETVSPDETATVEPTGTLPPDETETPDVTATATAVMTGTATSTATMTAEATETTTQTATAAATNTATTAVTATSTIVPTETSTALPTGTSTAAPTNTPTSAATAVATTTATPTGGTPVPEMDMQAARAYCETQGGTVTTRFPAYNTNAPQTDWLRLANPKQFCTFHSEPDSSGFRSQIEIELATLYTENPTLAVLAYLEPLTLPPYTGANPSTEYCRKLGGTDIFGGMDNAAGGAWVTEQPDSETTFQVVSMCVFPDMSAIDSWGLTYKASGVIRGVDLADVVRYQPATLPHVFVSSASPNSPAMNPADQTVTEADNGSDVTLQVGQILRVQLPGNPSTGYSWMIVVNDDRVLAPVGEPMFDLGTGTPMPGAGGTETFTFKAVAPGENTLSLVYVRPWEVDVVMTPDNTFTVSVTVE